MRYKKRKLHKLHSIPIGLCNKEKLYLVSYSIPLSCMVVLLLVMGISTGTWSSYSDVTHAEEGISTHIDVAHPTIAIDVSRNTSDGYGNEVAEQVTTAPGAGTAYRSHKVTVTGSDIQDYQLTISGPSELAPSSGAATVVSGAGGKTGEEMSNSNSNIWGYAWGEDGDDVTSMVYNTMTDTGSNLGCTSPSADYKVNCERKLVFGANFANTAADGTYTAEVQLSLIATPHLVGQAWSNGVDTGIDDMQDIDKVDGGFCRADIPSGSTITLRDSRGGVENLYKIMKMPDGTCWMVENLRLKANIEITPVDSDVNSNYTLPGSASVNSNTMNWDEDDNTAYMAEGSGSMKLSASGKPWQEAYGNYYSWCTATAMSCLEDSSGATRTGSAITNKEARESICPKNWKLPESTTGAGSFKSLYSSYPNSMPNVYWLTGQIVPYNGGTSGTSIDGYNGKRFGNDIADALFPAAGFIRASSNGLDSASSGGYYWSRRADSDTSRTYALSFDSTSVFPQNDFLRHFGFSVRCVADEIGVWTTPNNTAISTDIKTMQGVTKADFIDKYCTNNATANALVPIESTINLKDIRDDHVYTIVKLKDGKCWMQENLALSGSITLTSADSDVNSDWTLPSDTQIWSTQPGSQNVAQVKTGGTDIDASWKPGWGNYYSWQAATAGTGSGVASSGQQAEASICPKGWKLPTGGGNGSSNGTGQFGVLNGLNRYTVQSVPYNFFASGWYVGRSQEPTTRGMYWSRTLGGSGSPYALDFYGDYFLPGTTTDNISVGATVRCVADY